MITDISGARFRISFSQYKPSFPVFTLAEKFMSSRIMSTFFKASYPDSSLGVRMVLTVRYSILRRSSRAVRTFLLSSTMRMWASFIGNHFVFVILYDPCDNLIQFFFPGMMNQTYSVLDCENVLDVELGVGIGHG